MDEESAPPIETTNDPELRQMLGLFDAPAFARRGQDLEHALARLHARLGKLRAEGLDMVRLRLRQLASVSAGPDDASSIFSGPIADLWPLSGAESPLWSPRPSPARRRRAVARDLIASVGRFNARWVRLVSEMKLDAVNRAIDHYNRYYVLEKECVLGSSRLAARHFAPRDLVTAESLLAEYPPLPVPSLRPT